MSHIIPKHKTNSEGLPLPCAQDTLLFPLGQVVATPGALKHCANNDISPLTLIGRHHRGDWGDLCDDDRAANETALSVGGRLFSAYRVAGEKLYCVTECDRSVTTLLLAREY